jgi:hypothetical protein
VVQAVRNTEPWFRILGTALAAIALGTSLIGPAAALTPVTSPFAATPASAADPANARGFAQLGSCVASADRLEALYVIDMSGSNAQTDPQGARFEGLESSVAALGDLAGKSAGRLQVDAAVAAFGNGYIQPAEVADWRTIASPNARVVGRDLRAAAEQKWQALAVEEQSTNYEAALAGARSSVLARGTKLGTCRVLFWFTDGLFDVTDRANTDAASQRMCARNGLIDQLRQQDISVIAMALTNDAVREQLADPAFAGRRGELKAMVVGKSAEKTCGTAPVPENYRAGAYLNASDAGGLRGMFSGAVAQGRGGIPQLLATTRPVRLSLDPGIRSFQLDLTGEAPAASLQVALPNGARFAIPTTGVPSSVGGGEATARAFGTFVTLEVQMPGSGTAGTWTIDPGADLRSVTAYLFTGLRLRFDSLSGVAALSAGKPGVITGTAVDARGAPADLSVYKKATIGAVERRSKALANLESRIIDTGSGRFEVHLTPRSIQTTADIEVELRTVTTSGIVLSPVAVRQMFQVTLPATFPRLEPAGVLDLGTLRGTTETTRDITLIGSPDGRTRVCLRSSTDVQVPQRANGTTPSYDARCYNLGVNQRQVVRVAVKPAASADGNASAAIPITLTSSGGTARPVLNAERSLDVVWAMQRTVDQGRRALLLAVVTLLAVLLPLLMLWVINRFLARFDGGDRRRAVVPVLLDDNGPRRADGPPLIRPDDLRPHFIQSQQRKVELALNVQLRASAPLNPFGGPKFLAVASPGNRLVSSIRPHLLEDGHYAPVTPGLGNLWVMSVSEDDLSRAANSDEPVPATITVIVHGWGPKLTDDVSSGIRNEVPWPSLLATLRAATPRKTTPKNAEPQTLPRTAEDDALLTPAVRSTFSDPFASSTSSAPPAVRHMHDPLPSQTPTSRPAESPSKQPSSDDAYFKDPFA